MQAQDSRCIGSSEVVVVAAAVAALVAAADSRTAAVGTGRAVAESSAVRGTGSTIAVAFVDRPARTEADRRGCKRKMMDPAMGMTGMSAMESEWMTCSQSMRFQHMTVSVALRLGRLPRLPRPRRP